MTTETKSPFNIWNAVGKAGVVVGLIWGGMQIYNTIIKTNDFDADAHGNHVEYRTSPIILEGFNKSIEYKALAKTIIENKGTIRTSDLDKLVNAYKNEYPFSNNRDEIYPIKDYGWNGDHTSFWLFHIKNNGAKPLEELALELPFNGNCTIYLPNNDIKSKTFSNKIELGELRPSYEIKVLCWTNSEMYDIEGDEEKSRFTHKNGWFGIEYPVQVTGIYAWNQKNHDTPLFAAGVIIFAFFFFIYNVGEINGIEKQKKENSRTSQGNDEQVSTNSN